jgi:hypothetical protein
MADIYRIGTKAFYVNADAGNPQSVKVLSGATVYYGSESVSSSSNDGSITVGNSTTLTQGKWLVSTGASVLVAPAATTETFGAAQVLSPSGDTTGATDLAALNAALVDHDVFLSGNYYFNGSISIPSSRTLYLFGANLKLADTTNLPLLVNSDLTNGNSNIAVRGIGNRISNILDGNGANQVRQTTTNQWKNNLALFVKVTGLLCENLTVQNPNAWGISPHSGCTKVRLLNLESVDDGATTNRSPIQVYGACTDLLIDGVYGTSEDDGVALLTYNWTDQVSNTGAYVYNTSTAVGGTLAGNITKFTVRNVEGTWGTTAGGCVRLLAAGGNKILNGKIENLRNDGDGDYLVSFGSSTYFSSGKQAASADVSGIQVSNGQDNGSSGGKPLFDFSGACSNIKIQNIQCTGARISLFGVISAPTAVTISNIEAHGIQYTSSASTATKGLAFPTGYTVGNVKIQNVSGVNFGSILANGGTVTVLQIRDWRIGTARANTFASSVAETGTIDGVYITTLGAFHTYAEALKLRMGPNMPIATSADTVADATIKGSRLLCDHTLDPTGGGGTTGGEYIADGSNATTGWKKIIDLGASF